MSGALALVVVGFVAYVVGQDHPLDRPCPLGSRSIHPTQTHLTPSLQQHQSWVGIPSLEIADGDVVLICTDGRAVGRAVMDPQDVAADTVILDIPTRWADLTWATGRLDVYRDPSRWDVVLPPLLAQPDLYRVPTRGGSILDGPGLDCAQST